MQREDTEKGLLEVRDRTLRPKISDFQPPGQGRKEVPVQPPHLIPLHWWPQPTDGWSHSLFIFPSAFLWLLSIFFIPDSLFLICSLKQPSFFSWPQPFSWFIALLSEFVGYLFPVPGLFSPMKSVTSMLLLP